MKRFIVERTTEVGQTVTIKDIARKAGVSIGRGQHGLFEKRVQCPFVAGNPGAHHASRPGKQLYTKPLGTPPCNPGNRICSDSSTTRPTGYLQMGILQGIRKICSMHDYDIIVYPSDSLEQEAHNLGTLHVNNLDGILTIPSLEGERNNYSCYKALADRGIPVVQLLVNFWDEFPMIGRDYQKIGYEAVRAFSGKGQPPDRSAGFRQLTPIRFRGRANWALVKGAEKASEESGLELVIYPLKSDGRRNKTMS